MAPGFTRVRYLVALSLPLRLDPFQEMSLIFPVAVGMGENAPGFYPL